MSGCCVNESTHSVIRREQISSLGDEVKGNFERLTLFSRIVSEGGPTFDAIHGSFIDSQWQQSQSNGHSGVPVSNVNLR